MEPTTSSTTDDASSGGDSTGTDPREGPAFAGELHIETLHYPAGDTRVVFASANPEGETLCLYAENESFDEVLEQSITVPPRSLVEEPHPLGGAGTLRVRRATDGDCPPENPNLTGQLIREEGGLVVALNNSIQVVGSPGELANLRGMGHGAIANASTTRGALCVLDPDAVSDYGTFGFDRQSTYSLNDSLVDDGPDATAFIVPGSDEGCLTHTKWLEQESTTWLHQREAGTISLFVAFDGN